MYDYLSIRGDDLYSEFLSKEDFWSYFDGQIDFDKQTHFSYSYNIGKYRFLIQGIYCNALGLYSFNTDEHFERINLIEINIPQGSESIHEDEIRSLTNRIANHFNWEIDWNE